MKIGVYICYCGSNIAATVDVEAVAEYASQLPGVAVARTNKYTCSDPGQKAIRQDIVELGLDRVVVGTCSPRMHERTFRSTLKKAGLNPYYLEVANLREHCSWVHHDVPAATEKAKDLVRAAVERVRGHEPLFPRQVPVTQAALVVGGGIAGIQTALDIANAGFTAYLVERQPSIGGHMAQLDKTFPTLDCSACILTPKMVDVGAHPNIHLMAYSDVTEVKGFAGNFQVTVRHKPRYVDLDKCTSCADCVAVCPIHVPDEFNECLTERTAIFRPYAQAVPNAFLVTKKGTSPCKNTCPADTSAQGYIALIAQGRYEEALEVIKQYNPFPATVGRVCHHPCETECNRGKVDEPVAICALKRFVADTVYARWDAEETRGELRELAPFPLAPTELPPEEKRRVAVMGAGPGGLSAAHFLARMGYTVTIFEALPVPGGMMRVGIPAYRLPRDVLQREIDEILRLGVELRLNTPVRDINKLFDEGFAAVFLAIGAHEPQKLGIAGEDEAAGVFHGVPFLRAVNLGEEVRLGNQVTIVGGGNTAIDTARTALRLGSREVTIVYRRSRAEMPANPWEIEGALAEGVQLMELAQPVAVLSDNARIKGLRCVRMRLGEPDASGRRRPIPIEGSEFVIPCDTMVAAVAQAPEISFLDPDHGLEITRRGTFAVDPQTLATNRPGIFAGGDAAAGPGTLIEAIAAGRRGVLSIDRYLRGAPLLTPRELTPLPVAELTDDEVAEMLDRGEVDLRPRVEIPTAAVDERVQDFREVELALTEEQALAAAARCLRCGLCSECYQCVLACEREAVDHHMRETSEEIEVGAIVLATGFELFDVRRLPQYGYGQWDNVYTALEVERLTNASGPTDGEIVLKDGRPPESVAILHCIGSRDRHTNRYCSRVCCMYSMKLAHLIREKTHAQVYEFYFDITAFGKGYAEFHERVQEEGILFVRGKAAEVEEIDGKLVVRAEDTLLGEFVEVPVDMVVLSPAMVPAADAEQVAQLFRISRGEDSFFLEAHPKLRPVETNTDGIFLGGCCQGPKDIPDTVAQAGGAASQALGLLSRGYIEIEPMTAEVTTMRCVGCGLCVEVCPTAAIELKEWRPFQRRAEVNAALCKGCGLCVAACWGEAIILHGFTDQQLLVQLRSLLMPEMVLG